MNVDVCVYGGNSAGVAAAIQLQKYGRSVVLIEAGRHIGGMSSSGLGWTDFGNKDAIGGFSKSVYERVGRDFYDTDISWVFAPGAMEQTLRRMLDEAGVQVIFEHRVVAAERSGGRLVKATFEHVPTGGFNEPGDGPALGTLDVTAKVYLDCSYEGDLMPHAGVSYFVGREANSDYGETLNGVRDQTPKHQFVDGVDPYVTPGDPSSGLLPLMTPDDMAGGAPGERDHRVQAYNFRICFTNDPAVRVEQKQPPQYDPKRFELWDRNARLITERGLKDNLWAFLKPDMVTPTKTDINNNGALSTDYIGMNWDYPEADYATRARIWRDHLRYHDELFWHIRVSPATPEDARRHMNDLSFCRDEFTDTQGWPHQLYLREARRMVGAYVITQADCEHRAEPAYDSIGLGSYTMDSHNCQRWVEGGYTRNEGDTQVQPTGPYRVPYRAITPKRDECENLLVPTCFSATHIAYGSARMEPVFFIMGQSAAAATHLALDAKSPVQDVDAGKLRAELLELGQVLDPVT